MDMNTSTCKKCNVAQPVTEFTKSRFICVTCKCQQRKAYIAANKETLSAYNKAYRAANKERTSAYNKAYNINNRATIQPRSTRNHKRLRDTNPAFKMAHVFRCRLGKVMKGLIKSGNTFTLMGCTADQFKSWLEFNFTDGMTFENHGTLWHIDHVIPCCTFNLSDPEHQMQCFHWSNMKPMLARDNCSKSGRVIADEIPLHVGRILLFLNCVDID